MPEGEYLFELDGSTVDTTRSIYRYFAGKAGQRLRLLVGPNADRTDARQIEVKALEDEFPLRMAAWASRNRLAVAEWSGGKVVYVHLPGFDAAGLLALEAAFYEAQDGRALLLDQRFNGGGITADSAIEMLSRKGLYDYRFRQPKTLGMPLFALDAPKALLINHYNGSAAETFATMFRLAGLGSLVGTTTVGAGIGGFGDQPHLVDSAPVTIPNRAAFDPIGQWSIENRGVPPHVTVELQPEDDLLEGRGQLKKAVTLLLQQLQDHQPRSLKLPDYPNYGKPVE